MPYRGASSGTLKDILVPPPKGTDIEIEPLGTLVCYGQHSEGQKKQPYMRLCRGPDGYPTLRKKACFSFKNVAHVKIPLNVSSFSSSSSFSLVVSLDLTRAPHHFFP